MKFACRKEYLNVCFGGNDEKGVRVCTFLIFGAEKLLERASQCLNYDDSEYLAQSSYSERKPSKFLYFYDLLSCCDGTNFVDC